MADFITVKDVLGMPEFANARLLGGEGGLSNKVSSVAVAEIPDIAMWLSGQEFIHTTGKYFSNERGGVHEELFASWVLGLIETKSACLAVKTHRFIGYIPQSVIDIGNEFNYPIIELDDHTTQAMVSEVVYRLLTEHKIQRIEHNQQILASFIQEIAEPHSAHFGVDRISEHVDAPILLFDDKFHLLQTSHSLSEKEVRMLDIPRRVKALNEKDTIPQYVAADPNVHRKIQPLYEEEFTGEGGQLLIRPITSSERILGYCALLKRTTLETERISLFVALADVLVSDLVNTFRAKIAERRARKELFEAILAEQPDPRLIAHRATLTGIRLSQNMRIILISVADNAAQEEVSTEEISEWADQTVYQALREIMGSERAFLVSTWERGVAILLFGSHPVNRVKRIMKRLVATLQDRHLVDASCGIGTPARSTDEIVESARKARETLTIVEAFDLGPADAYETLGHYLMFASFLENPSKTTDYVSYILGPLIEKDETYTGLLETLEVFLATSGAYTAAARQLHMHVNTMRYRVEKINSLLPVDLETLDGRGAAWLALRMYQHNQH
ncbi:MAG: PucR family transcriptional regulator ligand-binding domain-containing protein [Actinomycetaceae bacterium]|nr:PucR family transcriptional regulator ligand-binding domain-containing protein [Actinomycetaceae bacterium]